MKLNIRGEQWTVALDAGRLEPDEDGATFPCEHLIVLSPDAPLAVVRHELMHAYCSTLYVGSCTGLSLDDFEEMVCDLMGTWTHDYVRQSGEVLQWMMASR